MVLHSSGNYSIPGSMTWYRNLYEPLLDLEHEVHLLRLEELSKEWKIRFRTRAFMIRLSEQLPVLFARAHKKKPFDLFFSYLTNLDIEPDALGRIKSYNIPMVNFSCNNIHQFYLVNEISPVFDYSLHSERDVAWKFTQVGANPVWFQMAANPKYYHPADTKKTIDISFVGSNYSKRGYYVLFLLEHGLKVHAYGPNWRINRPYPELKFLYKEMRRISTLIGSLVSVNPVQRYGFSSSVRQYDLQYLLRKKYRAYMHYPIDDVLLNATFNKSRLNLGFLEVNEDVHRPGSFTTSHLHLREFEIPMSGNLFLTNYSDELAEHFVPDKEVIVFHNEYELCDKCRYYLSRPEESGKIAMAGHARAINSHTCQLRFRNLFSDLKLDT
jgi:spore maturation protein CgeB